MAGAAGVHATGDAEMTTRTADGSLASARPAGAAHTTAARTRLRDLVLAALVPAACAALLAGLLSAWVATGGAGTITRVRIQISLAAVPMRAFTPGAASAVGAAATFLVIRNLSGSAGELVSVRSPAARHIVLTTHRGGAAGPRTVVAGLVIPAHATITLNPFGDDVVLMDPPPLRAGQTVPLTLTFRRGGTITVQAAVTPPGTP